MSINERCFSNFDFTFPLNRFICITGLSGTGKSSLLNIIFRALNKSSTAWMGLRGMGEIIGKGKIRRPYLVDQTPIGNNPRSTPATYLGVWDRIRDAFAETEQAKHLGFNVSHFSFNTQEGQCQSCQGMGYVPIPDEEETLWEYCPVCNGRRYRKEILKVYYDDFSIADALKLTVDEAAKVFSDSKLVKRKLSFLQQVNLGYLALGQSSGSLSGGESQRIKLAKELSKRLGDRCVYLLDTPSRGLHLQDLPILANVFKRLVEKNNTVIIVDNHEELYNEADIIVRLESKANGKSEVT
ncbi:MAG: ATP-binding cassette domain-containing protein [bacterium]|nr:ATP-binding cassette domain-containing protein [bacterium]